MIRVKRSVIRNDDSAEEIVQKLLNDGHRQYGSDCKTILNMASYKLLVFRNAVENWVQIQEIGYIYGLGMCNGNIYMNGINVHGLPQHKDPYDIIVIQISGRKCWKIFGEDGNIENIILERGDLLFLPKDTVHQAFSDSISPEISIHVSLHALADEPSRKAIQRQKSWSIVDNYFVPTSFLTAQDNSLRAHIEDRIKEFCTDYPNVSVYLRGSCLTETEPHPKADIDLVVFGNIDIRDDIEVLLSDLNRRIDIGYFETIEQVPFLLYMLLAIQSHCIVGISHSFSPILASRSTAKQIWNFMPFRFSSSLPVDPKLRVGLIKRIIRSIAVIELARKGVFSRDLKCCIEYAKDLDTDLGSMLQVLYDELEYNTEHSLDTICEKILFYASQEGLI